MSTAFDARDSWDATADARDRPTLARVETITVRQLTAAISEALTPIEALELRRAVIAWRDVDAREFDTPAWHDATRRLRDVADRVGGRL